MAAYLDTPDQSYDQPTNRAYGSGQKDNPNLSRTQLGNVDEAMETAIGVLRQVSAMADTLVGGNPVVGLSTSNGRDAPRPSLPGVFGSLADKASLLNEVTRDARAALERIGRDLP